MADLTREQIERLRADATRGPLRLTRNPANPDGTTPSDLVVRNLAMGRGPLWGVMAPDHPLSVGGWDDEPEHAVMTCFTGNGPTSEGNARLYAAAPDVAAWALARDSAATEALARAESAESERDRLAAEVARLRALVEAACDAIDATEAMPTNNAEEIRSALTRGDA